MFLTAHRVRGPAEREGIHAFLYRHDVEEWESPPDPKEDCGALTRQLLVIEPGGNLVRSYLDITTPLATPWREVRAALVRGLSSQTGALPWEGVSGVTRFGFAVERSLASQWRKELDELFTRITEITLIENWPVGWR